MVVAFRGVTRAISSGSGAFECVCETLSIALFCFHTGRKGRTGKASGGGEKRERQAAFFSLAHTTTKNVDGRALPCSIAALFLFFLLFVFPCFVPLSESLLALSSLPQRLRPWRR